MLGWSYLPVDGGVGHELLKAPLHALLETAGLVALAPKLSALGGGAGVQLQEQNQVRLRQSHVGPLAPVYGEVLETKPQDIRSPTAQSRRFSLRRLTGCTP